MVDRDTTTWWDIYKWWTETVPLGGTLLSGGQRKGHHIPPTLTLAGKKGRLGATRDETDGRL